MTLDAARAPFYLILAELVGPTGSLAALDLSPQNVATLEQRLIDSPLPCPVAAKIGSVLNLPYPDASFDAAWCANTTVYFNDVDLAALLAELRRVVRSGGLVAVKDVDGTLTCIQPAPPGIILRFYEAERERQVRLESAGYLRAAALPSWLRQAGLANVWRRATLIERAAPLDPVSRRIYRQVLEFFATRAATLTLPATDQAIWARLRDASAREGYLDDPDFYGCEGNILTVGTVPSTTA